LVFVLACTVNGGTVKIEAGDEKQVQEVNILMKHGQKQNTDSVWTGENKTDNNADTGMKQRKEQMCVMMVTGLRNEWQPGALRAREGKREQA
jgi:hypothetical protein